MKWEGCDVWGEPLVKVSTVFPDFSPLVSLLFPITLDFLRGQSCRVAPYSSQGSCCLSLRWALSWLPAGVAQGLRAEDETYLGVAGIADWTGRHSQAPPPDTPWTWAVCTENICSPRLCILLPEESSPDCTFYFFPLSHSLGSDNSGSLEVRATVRFATWELKVWE